MESQPASYETEEIIDMIEQLILCGDVPCFFSKSFDQMPRLSSFLQSLQQASIPIPDLEIVFFSLSATL